MSFSALYMAWFIVTGIFLLKVWIGQLLIHRKAIIDGELHGVAITHLVTIFIPVAREIVLVIILGTWAINRIGDLIAYALVELAGEDTDAG